MDIKTVKKMIALAKKQGLKSMTVGDFSISFQEPVRSLPMEQLAEKSAAIVKSVIGDEPIKNPAKLYPAPDPAPNLEAINDYIYGPAVNEEASA